MMDINSQAEANSENLVMRLVLLLLTLISRLTADVKTERVRGSLCCW